MAMRKGLGKGLGALIEDFNEQPNTPGEGAATLPLQKIEPNPLQPRKTFNPEELDSLADSIRMLADMLKPQGRLCVITFHSLEDRIVKNTFRELANPCTCPPEMPVCVCGKKPTVKLITRKPITASAEELAENPRSRSASLRVLEKI